MNIARKLTAGTWQKATIDEYVQDIRAVWGSQDDKRTMVDVWLRVVQHASSFGELVRRKKFDLANDQLARVTIWMLTFVNKGALVSGGFDGLFALPNKTLSNILWNKFPNCCHACFTRHYTRENKEPTWGHKSPHECDCILTLAETEERSIVLTPEQKDAAKRVRRTYAERFSSENDYGKIGLHDLEERFESIFRRNIFALDLEHITFHFLEEVGEVAEAMTSLYTFPRPAGVPFQAPPDYGRMYKEWQARQLELEDEVADAFSWLFAVSSKIRDTFKTFDSYTRKAGIATNYAEQMYLAAHLEKRHRHEARSTMKCWDCGMEKCNCGIDLVLDDDAAKRLFDAG